VSSSGIAGAELCQAQVKLGLAKPSLSSKKLSMATSFMRLRTLDPLLRPP
jgi:hypothetical protein